MPTIIQDKNGRKGKVYDSKIQDECAYWLVKWNDTLKSEWIDSNTVDVLFW